MNDEEDQPDVDSPTPDISDERVVREKNRQAGRRQKRLDDTLAGMLANQDVRVWLWDLMSRCNINRSSLVVGQPDATAFNEGQRSIGMHIQAEIIRIDPAAFIQMMKENGGLAS